ncbi:MAG: hypothetical protein PHS57_00785 [Alphaproteobacteria bacterium]|nr:hypothetical protein [Alphaproteobacteria bacterium]
MKNIVKKLFLPAIQNKRGKTSLTTPSAKTPQPPQSLPNATIIYGIGASLFLVIALSLLLSGKLFSGAVLGFIGACLIGFALHLLKHQD